jgi:hypothetical protein
VPTGGVFSRQVEVVWGGGERLSITQEFQGIDEHEHLLVSTSLEGRVPELAPGASVHIQAYQEVYQHSGNCNATHSTAVPVVLYLLLFFFYYLLCLYIFIFFPQFLVVFF